MQLLVDQIKNKTTAPYILCNKITLVLLLFFHTFSHFSIVTAELTCHQCRGINCLRTSYKGTQKCHNDLDICVNIFDGHSILAQGCWEQLPEDMRKKCDNEAQTLNSKELISECFKCNENLCNNLSSSSFKCIQCDSDSDDDCRTNPLTLAPSRCDISRTPNAYCFVRQEGKRVIRGCSYTVETQISCLHSDNCMICEPNQLSGCNDIQVTMDNRTTEGENTNDKGSENDLGNKNARTCHQCSGINCLRTSYEATQTCLNDLDICATVFDGQTILAQGCWEELAEDVRNKCNNDTQCVKCNKNLCNNLASSTFQCIQCDSDSDDNCRTNPHSLAPSQCGISRTLNQYCFVKKETERVIRGCSYNLEEQMTCFASEDCMICQPSELVGCNNIELSLDNSDSGSGNDSGSAGEDAGNNESTNGSDGDDSKDGGSGDEHTENSGSGSGGGSEDNGNGSDGEESGGNTENGGSDTGDGENGDESSSSSTSIFSTKILIIITLALILSK